MADHGVMYTTGEGTENAEDNIAGDLGGHPTPGAGTGRKLLQENRIGDGAGAILDAAGANSVGGAVAGEPCHLGAFSVQAVQESIPA